MLRFGNTCLAHAPVTADVPGDRDADIYDRYASGLYRQALLTLDDAHLAEQVVCDVLVEECSRTPAPGATRTVRVIAWRCRPTGIAGNWPARRGRTGGPGSGLPGALPGA
jgi:hypothetical protein